MELAFLKMHGAGNDFVVLDGRARRPAADEIEALVIRLCDRRRGIGADGVLILERDPELDFAMSYFNADGRRAEYCGNGARCLARRALELGLGKGGEVRFRTDAGIQTARRSSDGRGIELHFGRVEPPRATGELEAARRTFAGQCVTAGVPHLVVQVERVEWAPVAEWGSALRHHERFAPAGTNVDFVARLGPARLAMRTYERGVEAETLACGSGAIASAVCALESGAPSPVAVVTAGGDELRVAAVREGGGWDVRLAGPAEIAFEGTWREPAPVLSSGGG